MKYQNTINKAQIPVCRQAGIPKLKPEIPNREGYILN